MSEPIYWTTKNGVKMNVDDMDENHVRNAFKMLLSKIRKQNEILNDLFGEELDELYGG